MSCERFTDRLDGLLAGTLSADERAWAAAHAADCPRCGEAYALADGASGRGPVEAPGDLADAVLSRTCGQPCEAARARLGDLLHGGLGPVDHRLVEEHLRHCPECAALAAAAARLGVELPAFADLTPPPAFADAVLARTRGRTATRRAVVGRWRDAARRLFTRPRIAWEAGYVAALVFWLVFGASWSPLRTTAVEARILLQQSVSVAREVGADSAASVNRTVAGVVDSVASVNRTVAGVSDRIVRAAARGADDFAGRFAGRWRRAAAAAPDLGRHWRQLVEALEGRDVFGGVDALRLLSRDAAAMLAGLFSPSSSTAAADDAPRPAERSRP